MLDMVEAPGLTSNGTTYLAEAGVFKLTLSEAAYIDEGVDGSVWAFTSGGFGYCMANCFWSCSLSHSAVSFCICLQ